MVRKKKEEDSQKDGEKESKKQSSNIGGTGRW